MADRFPTTRISLVLAASMGSSSQARDAEATLYRIYWQPIYGYLRRLGHSAEDAQDLTQGFLTRLVEKNALRDFDRERGRFRSFLLGCLKHFLANERDAARTLKRGGGLVPVPLEDIEPRDDLTPEKIFEKQWALALLNRVLANLREEAVRAGKHEQFDRFRGFLSGDEDRTRYRQVAQELSMSEGAVKVAIHRLRQRFHEALREEVSLTVGDPEDVSDEIRYLIAAVRG
jgi:RNA polymerase sigma factor (sigma-70 family)